MPQKCTAGVMSVTFISVAPIAVCHFRAQLRRGAVGLYAIGALAAMGAYLAGRTAAESVMLSPAADSVLSEHETWATWTTWFYCVFALARVAAEYWIRRQRWSIRISLSVVGALGTILLLETGEHGLHDSAGDVEPVGKLIPQS